jgi:hypothetical protein
MAVGPEKDRRKALLSMPQVAAINRFAELIVARPREVKTHVEIVQRVHVTVTRHKRAKRR